MTNFAAALLLGASALAAPPMNLLKTIDDLPELAAPLEARYPSMGMGLTGPGDLRIVKFARETGRAFKLAWTAAGRTEPSFILVDPSRRSGFLWWRGATVVLLRAEDLTAARAGKSPLSPQVVAFVQNLAPVAGAQEPSAGSGR